MECVTHLHERLKALVGRLNRIEERIKEAELICGQVVFPAVNELRYMARNLTSLIDLALTSPDARNSAERSVESYFSDAEMCCIRADHDITDAVFAYISLEVDALRRQYGASIIAAHLENYSMLIEHLQQTQRLIIESRGQRRTSMRISTYDDIQEQHLPKIIEIFQQLRRNSDLLKAHYLRLIKTSRTGLLVGAILGLFGFVASAASILSWFGVDWSQVNHLDEPKAAIAEQTEQFPAERPQSLHHTEKPRHLIDTPQTITDSIDSPPSE